MAQNQIALMLASDHRQITIVGDGDQSVYGWRGADIRNITQFEDTFEDVTTIVLDQNYRSTQVILDAANAVIANNPDRKEKHLWSELGAGDKIRHDPDKLAHAVLAAATHRGAYDNQRAH